MTSADGVALDYEGDDAIHETMATRYANLVDPSETLLAAIPAIYEPRGKKHFPRAAGLLVTDRRLIIGTQDPQNRSAISCIWLSGRLYLLDPQPHADHLRTTDVRDLRFELDKAELLASIDRDAERWGRIDDPTLGVLLSDDRGRYMTSLGILQSGPGARNRDIPVRLRLNLDGDRAEEVLTRGRQIAADAAPFLAEAEDAIVGEFLNLKNECWLNDGEAELSEKEFRDRLLIQAVEITEGINNVHFFDDQMFGGHGLVAIDRGRGSWDAVMWG